MLRQINRWRDLSALDRAAWRAAAAQKTFPNRLGIQRNLTGYQYFLKYNLFNEINNPPLTQTVWNDIKTTLTFTDANSLTVLLTSATSIPVLEAHLYGRLLYRNTPIRSVTSFRHLGLATMPFGGTFFFPILWNSVFEDPAVGQYVALQLRPFVAGVDIGGWEQAIVAVT